MTSGTVEPAPEDVCPSDAGPEPFERFYRAEVGRVLAVVLALRGPASGSEDVVQEAFARAFQRWGELARMDRPELWVQRVALNLATSRLRRAAAESRAVARLAGRSERATDELLAPALIDAPFWDAVRRLPAKQARVVALRYAGDLSVDEIAEVAGVAAGTVSTQLTTARRRLAQLLHAEGEDRS